MFQPHWPNGSLHGIRPLQPVASQHLPYEGPSCQITGKEGEDMWPGSTHQERFALVPTFERIKYWERTFYAQ